MIFGAALLPKVLDGSKVETRRKARPEEGALWQPGRDYAIQPRRGAHAIARFVVSSVHREPVGALTEEGAVREGFASVAEFEAYWRLLYKTYDPATEVWVIAFDLLPAPE